MAASRSGRCRRSACRPETMRANAPGPRAPPGSSAAGRSCRPHSRRRARGRRSPRPAVLSKTIREPSGDHDGWRSIAGSGASVTSPVPSALDHVNVARLRSAVWIVRRVRDARPVRGPGWIQSLRTSPDRLDGSGLMVHRHQSGVVGWRRSSRSAPGRRHRQRRSAIEPAAAHRIAAVMVMMRCKRGLPVDPERHPSAHVRGGKGRSGSPAVLYFLAICGGFRPLWPK